MHQFIFCFLRKKNFEWGKIEKKKNWVSEGLAFQANKILAEHGSKFKINIEAVGLHDHDLSNEHDLRKCNEYAHPVDAPETKKVCSRTNMRFECLLPPFTIFS